MAKFIFNPEEVYGDRLKQIDKEIGTATRKRQWTLKKMLENEKDRLNKILDGTKEG